LGAVSVVAGGILLGLFYQAVKSRRPFIRISARALTPMRFREMMGYGVGMQAAAILIALREPLYKVMILRSGGLSDLATFEISYKLCVQAMSIVSVPLLGLLGAVSLLSNRKSELTEVLKPALACSVGLGLPMLMLVASFADRIVPMWLGPIDFALEKVLPVVFTAFVLYYSSESLYKSIQGLGGVQYCAVIQSVVLAINLGGFALLADRVGMWAYPLSLLAGFAVFSISNWILFRHMLQGERLLTGSQLFSLLWPSCLYGAALLWSPAWALPFLYIGYLVAHVWALRRGSVYDFWGLTKDMVGGKVLAWSR
jgi:O-antigen/teichoic acid export membrane protein